MIGYRRNRSSYSEKEMQHIKHRKKLEKERRKKGKQRRNWSWFICAFSAFCIMVGSFMPVVDVMFEDATYSLIMVTIFGVSSTYVAGEIVVFTYLGTLIPGIVLFISGALTLKFSYNIQQEKEGKWPLRILILSIIDVLMLILSTSLIMIQKSFFTSHVGYTLSLNDVSVIASLGFYTILIGAILGFVAIGWDKFFKYRIKKGKEVGKLEE